MLFEMNEAYLICRGLGIKESYVGHCVVSFKLFPFDLRYNFICIMIATFLNVVNIVYT